MNPSYKIKQTKQFVADFKEANKNTVQKVSKYDPVRKIWFFQTIKLDENVKNFAKKYMKSEAEQRRIEKKEKSKNIIVTRKSMSVEALKKMPTKPKSEMRKNVVRLTAEGKTVSEIAKMYNSTPRRVSVALCKEKNGY